MAYFLHPAAFPMLSLPWWMEASIRAVPSRSFQADVIYSTICGYYAIRMIDDLMDGDADPDAPVLPALLLLDAEALRTYHRHFEAGHRFWDLLASATDAGAESASREVSIEGIDRSEFLATCARKTAGATVPLAAVACRYGRPEAFHRWSEFVDRFGRWHQLLNDVRDWAHDLDRGRTSWFLSEGERRSPGAPGSWILGDGLAWARGQLDGFMAGADESASSLRSRPLLAYLRTRQDEVDREWRDLGASIADLERRLVAPGAGSTPQPP